MNNMSSQSPATSQLDDTFVPEELISRLHLATKTTILDLVETLTAPERANLAMFCYRKTHLRCIGLAIAATCDQPSLVQQWGAVLGQNIFTQSRAGVLDPDPVRVTHRPKITLARSTGRSWPPLTDFDDDPASV